MCGIAGIFGSQPEIDRIEAMVNIQHHRGPDAQGVYVNSSRTAALGHNRLSIIDLSDAGREPMHDPSERYWLTFNGEVYNYLELRRELESEYEFRSQTDAEVLLAAFVRWGESCLERFIGMFAFAIWDEKTRSLFAARDRFGVKPLYYNQRSDGGLVLASEIRTLHAGGVPATPDTHTWATYLANGLCDHTERTFWDGIRSLPPGHLLKWRDGKTHVSRWYDLAQHAGADPDPRPVEVVEEEYRSLLIDSVRLRFRADVPVGINISGGLDSSMLLGLVHAVQGPDSDVKAFTFATGDPNYDEIPWVQQMLSHTQHPSVICHLAPGEVPGLAESVHDHQSEPFGGLPTLAYARLFEQARNRGVVVLLDGQGMDEQWAGYDYYLSALTGAKAGVVQGTNSKPVKPDCLIPDFRVQAERFEQPFTDPLSNLQYRDARYTKIPRALRFNDRVSMRVSTELREPFLDHRLFELAIRQPPDRKIADGARKWLVRRIAKKLAPNDLVEAPKRPLQTPQREWLRGPLAEWADSNIRTALSRYGGSWLNKSAVEREWLSFRKGQGDNSFFVWQWISLGLLGANRWSVATPKLGEDVKSLVVAPK